jgi:TRAP-type C4-dicarboxylate transport system substrate-binding protein
VIEAAKKSWVVFVLAAACLLVAGTQSADADGKTVIRYATLAPSGSTFGKVLKAWSRSLQKETEGRVELRYYSGGSQGDERDFIRKMRAGQMDAAGVTSTGLGIIVRPVLVLSSPGLIETYDQLERVREKMTPRFDEMFREAGRLRAVGLGRRGEGPHHVDDADPPAVRLEEGAPVGLEG